MSLKIAARLVLSLILVGSFAGLGMCADAEEALEIAKELKVSIEQNSCSGVLKYVHGRTCFGDDCYEKDELLNLLKDEGSWPSQMLFLGEYSIRKYLLEKNNLIPRALNVDAEKGFWQIMLVDPDHEFIITPMFFFVKDVKGWRITHIDFE